MMDLARLEARCRDWVSELLVADSAHDVSHIKRVVNNTRYLTDIEDANPLVTLPSAWLHDCVQVPKDSPERAMVSRLAADQACRFLTSIGYPDTLLPEVHHAIEAHSYSANIPVRSVEAAVVQDADRMDALGAIGVARCLLTGGALGSGLYNPVDPFCAERQPDDRAWAVDHFYAKLFTLPSTMQTQAGRQEAERRVTFMRRYLDELGHEINSHIPETKG
jgi:uncharacterized protein